MEARQAGRQELEVDVGGQGIAAAIGVAGSNNTISGKTEALIQNSNVVAENSNSAKIKTNSKLKTDGGYLIDGAVTSNTWKSSKLQTGREEEEKEGVVVDASATHSIASVLANGGVAVAMGDGGIAGSVAGVVNLNHVSGSTTARVLDSQINNKDKRSGVTVHPDRNRGGRFYRKHQQGGPGYRIGSFFSGYQMEQPEEAVRNQREQ